MRPKTKHPKGPLKPKTGESLVPPDVKAARKLSTKSVESILNELMHLSVTELQTILRDNSLPVQKVFIASVLARGIAKGDDKRLNFIFDRTIGAVQSKLELSGSGDNPLKVELTLEQVKARIKELQDEAELLGDD